MKIIKTKVLVTGCAGFIGSKVTDTLLFKNFNVIGIDSFIPYYSIKIKQHNLKSALKNEKFKLIRMDLSEVSIHELHNILKNIDYVIHEAAQPGVRDSWGIKFDAYVKHNILATQKLLEAAIRSDIKNFIYASSSSVYGNLKTMPLREDTILNPYSPYGITKLAAENLCKAYHENYGLPVTILRYFTVYGPRQRPDMAFYRFIKSMLKRDPVTIYGDGFQRRDFTYIDDIVNATLNAMKCESRLNGEVINIGSSKPIKLIEAVNLIADIIGVEPKIIFNEEMRGDVKITYADISKAKKLLNWRPKTKLREGLEREIKWIKEIMNLGIF